MNRVPKVFFINTYNVVVPLLDYLIPTLRENHIDGVLVAHKSGYRQQDKSLEGKFIPSLGFKNKFYLQLIFALFAPFFLLTKRRELDVYFTQPPFFVIIGSSLSRVRRIPYIVHVMDVYPDFLFSINYIRKDSRLGKLLTKIMVSTLNKAEKVVVIGNCMRNRLVEMGLDRSKMQIITNFSRDKLAISSLKQSNEQSLRNKYGISGKMVVLYSGNMGIPHFFYDLLEIASLFNQSKEFSFVFVGHGARKGEIVKHLESNELDNIVLLESLTTEDYYNLLFLADAHFVSLRSEFTGISVPSKFYSSAFLGSYVIFQGDRQSEIADIVECSGFGQWVPLHNVVALKKAILSIPNKESFRENARAFYVEQLSSKIQLPKYVQLIDNVLMKRRIISRT